MSVPPCPPPLPNTIVGGSDDGVLRWAAIFQTFASRSRRFFVDPTRVRGCRYHRYGLEDEDFLAAFEGLRTVERGYDGLARAFDRGDRTVR